MPVATIMILDAAFVRWPVPVKWWDLQAAETCCVVLLVLLMGYDLWSLGWFHRTTLWAGLLVIALQQVRKPFGHTALFQSLATWVQSHAGSWH